MTALKIRIRSTLFAFLLQLLVFTVFGQEGCQLKKDGDGIKVWLCETNNSAFKTIKVEFEAEATLKEYAAGLLDIESYKYWQHNIIEPRILKTINEKELIYYSEVDTPWPISNRDLIFYLKMWQDSISLVLKVSLEQLPNYLPVKDGIVRIPEAESLLTVAPINDHRVKVTYVLHVDPGGEVPAFLANMFASQTPWQTFKNYRDRLESGNTTKIPIPFIRNYNSKGSNTQ
ncbi:MAG: hypothetical protein KDC79_00175 [Cyclobacteriaceae bacterium]|nr:hypothetical protein [Cyclobacteriaceae bacterium]